MKKLFCLLILISLNTYGSVERCDLDSHPVRGSAYVAGHEVTEMDNRDFAHANRALRTEGRTVLENYSQRHSQKKLKLEVKEKQKSGAKDVYMETAVVIAETLLGTVIGPAGLVVRALDRILSDLTMTAESELYSAVRYSRIEAGDRTVIIGWNVETASKSNSLSACLGLRRSAKFRVYGTTFDRFGLPVADGGLFGSHLSSPRTPSVIRMPTDQDLLDREDARLLLMQILQEVLTKVNGGMERLPPEETQVMILGGTGAGKSTLIHQLLGRPVDAERSAKTGKFQLVVRRGFEIKDFLTGDPISIGHSTSCTSYPNVVYEGPGRLIWWDCPGFFDTRSTLTEFSNQLAVSKIFSGSKASKILLVTPQAAFDYNRAQPVWENVAAIVTMFKDRTGETDGKVLDELKKNLFFVVTQVDEYFNLKGHLEEMAVSVPATLKENVKDITRGIMAHFAAYPAQKCFVSNKPTSAGEFPLGSREAVLRALSPSMESPGARFVATRAFVAPNAEEVARRAAKDLKKKLEASFDQYMEALSKESNSLEILKSASVLLQIPIGEGEDFSEQLQGLLTRNPSIRSESLLIDIDMLKILPFLQSFGAPDIEISKLWGKRAQDKLRFINQIVKRKEERAHHERVLQEAREAGRRAEEEARQKAEAERKAVEKRHEEELQRVQEAKREAEKAAEIRMAEEARKREEAEAKRRAEAKAEAEKMDARLRMLEERAARAEAAARIPFVAWGHEAEYQRFLNGVLIYKPNKDNDVGRVDIPISSLRNPLEGTFALSRFGDTGEYISIHTGYKKGKIPANDGKIEIWFTPKFLVEANLGGDAAWLRGIMGKWTHPWGMFWTWGGYDCRGDNFDYLLRSDVLEDKSKNCYDRWRLASLVAYCVSTRATAYLLTHLFFEN